MIKRNKDNQTDIIKRSRESDQTHILDNGPRSEDQVLPYMVAVVMSWFRQEL